MLKLKCHILFCILTTNQVQYDILCICNSFRTNYDQNIFQVIQFLKIIFLKLFEVLINLFLFFSLILRNASFDLNKQFCTLNYSSSIEAIASFALLNLVESPILFSTSSIAFLVVALGVFNDKSKGILFSRTTVFTKILIAVDMVIPSSSQRLSNFFLSASSTLILIFDCGIQLYPFVTTLY